MEHSGVGVGEIREMMLRGREGRSPGTLSLKLMQFEFRLAANRAPLKNFE